MVRFLTEEVGLDPNQLSFTYYGGGPLTEAAEASGRKLNLADKSLSFPPDTVTREVLKGLGLGGNQIIAETSLDTFLAEFPAPIEFWAGYRYEVFYTDPDTQERIEIGTGERLEYRRLVWEAERIRGSMTGLAVTKDIVPHPGCFAACGIGLERVLTVTNGLATPYECDHIAPVYDMTLSKARVRDEQAARVLTDALRTLHLVVADGFGFDSLPSRHLKNAYGKYCCELDRCARMLGVDDTALGELCAVNAAAQPWYEELAEATPRVLQELAAYRRRVASAGGGTDGR
jgi:alanyl-tRNA synthetase